MRVCKRLLLFSLSAIIGVCVTHVPAKPASRPQTGAAAAAPPVSGGVVPSMMVRTFVGPDGKPLPFKNDAEVLEFLRTAKVTKEKGIPRGVTGPRRLTMEKDGIVAEAVFRDVDEEKTSTRLSSGINEPFFRDSYIMEPAAYELSLILGTFNVPPAAVRNYMGRQGSVQIWIEGGMTEEDRIKKKALAPDMIQWSKQVHVMNVWDQLVYNTDRNQGNIVITPEWNLWLIDHTRAFRKLDVLLDKNKIRQCDRALFERLKGLDQAVLMQRLSPFLRKSEITAIMKRRDLVVKRINELIAQNGEEHVLFTLAMPTGAGETRP